MDKKITLAGAAVIAVLLAGGWEWMSLRNTQAEDRASLAKQMPGTGMSGGMPDPEKMQDAMMDDMAKDLGLSADQKATIKPIQAEMFSRMRAIFERNSTTQEKKMEEMQEMQKRHEAAIRAALTPEQQTKLDALRKQMKGRMGAMDGPGGTMPPGGPMTGPGGPMSPGGRAIPIGGQR